MTSVQELKDLGEGIGLSGEALQIFIKEQQTEERTARTHEREEREKVRQLELAKLELENKKLELDHQTREKQMEFELRRLQLHDPSETREATSLSAVPLGRTKIPKMPYFDEDKDCMDSYLNRFERFAQVEGWKKESYAIYLSALLKGKALDVYSRLASDQATDYNCLKTGLLKRYQLSEDGFKRKFRTARAEVGESQTQFITRLASYLQRSMELAEADQTYDGLAALIAREQYLSACPPDMAMFLK